MRTILTTPFKKALIVENPDSSLDGYLEAMGIEPIRLDAVPSTDDLIATINATGAHILFKRSRVPVSRRLVESCPSLHMVQLCCIGSDSVDLEACADNGVIVCNDPISNGRSVVELFVGEMISMARRLYETDIEMHRNDWKKTATGRYEVMGKRLGIVGLGNIGRQVARVAEMLDMEVSFYDDRFVAQEVGREMGWTPASSLEELFRSSDVVTLHTSANDHKGRSNECFLDEVLGQLGADRPENSPRLFLNLARGNLYSPEVLLEAVRSGAIRFASVDVYPSEPRPGQESWQNPYADEPRIACTPHIGAATQEAQPRIAARVAQTVKAFNLFGGLRDCVYNPRAELRVDPGEGHALLVVVHSDTRGTKKAVDDAIYEAEASNLHSTHRDFAKYGVAYELSVLDRPLPEEELARLVHRAQALAGEGAIRAVRQLVL